MLVRLLGLSLLLLLPACQGALEAGPATRGQTPATVSPTKKAAAAVGRFDGLTITLELQGASMVSGGEVGSSLAVTNESEETIIDPACLIGSGRYALVPVNDPDADLWLQPVVDCGGAFRMPEGFIDRYDGPTFPASTQHGEALAPGPYLATLEIEGYSERLQQPVEVTD